MKLNNIYQTTLTDRKLVNYFKKISDTELLCESTKLVYYTTGLSLKINDKITIIPLARVDLGYIIYLSNRLFSVGKFILISKIEFDFISKLDIKLNNTKVNVSSWRHFWYKDDIIKEYSNPIKFLTNRIDSLVYEKNHIDYQIESLDKDKNNLLKRFN